jgi:hypothetical protein
MSKSFAVRRDAKEWATQMEHRADRHELPVDPRGLQRITLGELVRRYRDTVSVRKKAYDNEAHFVECASLSSNMLQATLRASYRGLRGIPRERLTKA